MSPKSRESKTAFTFIDLFAGIGGFRLGASSEGGKCVFTSEWDRFSVQTYSFWYGEEPVSDDIRLVDLDLIPSHDLLLAGFPCQPFSLAGVSKKNSLGRAHGFKDANQGNLFLRILDIVSAKKPKILVLENVKNLKSHDKGATWTVIRESLENEGYFVRHEIIDARSWVPQHRERIFIVAFNREFFSQEDVEAFSFPEPPDRSPRLGEILERNPNPKYMLSDHLWAYLQAYAAKHRALGNGFGFGLAARDGISRTLSARYHKDGAEILIEEPGWRNPRRLSPSEAARLMGFDDYFAAVAGLPDGFPQVVSDTQAYRQFGNSVSPYVVKAIIEKLRPYLVRSSSGAPKS